VKLSELQDELRPDLGEEVRDMDQPSTALARSQTAGKFGCRHRPTIRRVCRPKNKVINVIHEATLCENGVGRNSESVGSEGQVAGMRELTSEATESRLSLRSSGLRLLNPSYACFAAKGGRCRVEVRLSSNSSSTRRCRSALGLEVDHLGTLKAITVTMTSLFASVGLPNTVRNRVSLSLTGPRLWFACFGIAASMVANF
jgi:hypothetical protein